MKTFKIVSDGTRNNTKLYDDTGRDVTGILKVTSITWEVTALGPTATIQVIGLAIEAEGVVNLEHTLKGDDEKSGNERVD